MGKIPTIPTVPSIDLKGETNYSSGGPSASAILGEDGTYILAENGTYILQE